MRAADRLGRDVVVPTVILAELYRGPRHNQLVDSCLSRETGVRTRDTDQRLARLIGGVLAGAGDLGRAPGGRQIGRGDHADHRVGPPQPFVQSRAPRLAQRDPVARILVQEHLVASLDQPFVHLTGQLQH